MSQVNFNLNTRQCYKCKGIGQVHSSIHDEKGKNTSYFQKCKGCQGTGNISEDAILCEKCLGKGFIHDHVMAHSTTNCKYCKECITCSSKGWVEVPQQQKVVDIFSQSRFPQKSSQLQRADEIFRQSRFPSQNSPQKSEEIFRQTRFPQSNSPQKEVDVYMQSRFPQQNSPQKEADIFMQSRFPQQNSQPSSRSPFKEFEGPFSPQKSFYGVKTEDPKPTIFVSKPTQDESLFAFLGARLIGPPSYQPTSQTEIKESNFSSPAYKKASERSTSVNQIELGIKKKPMMDHLDYFVREHEGSRVPRTLAPKPAVAKIF